jgi:hypothetical protein
VVDLRSRIHGAGATRGVNIVVMAYDDRVVTDDGLVTHFLDARVHPGDRRAPGETDLALVPEASDGRPVHCAPYSDDQIAAIERAAGDNVSDLIDVAGIVVGRAYGIRADLLIEAGAVVVNTKTLRKSDLSVRRDAHGRDIRDQIESSVRLARRAQASIRAAALEEPALAQ